MTKHPNHARFDRVNPAISGTRRIDRRQSRAVSEAGKMGNIRSGLLAAAVGIAVLAPQAASANVITETYTMTQVPAVAATD